MDEILLECSIAQLRARYADRSLCCLDVVRWHLARVAALDQAGPALNCVITLNPEAEQRARDLDAGAPRGPLHGVPVVVKDNFDVAGLPSTGGSAALRELVPANDAEVVTRLEAAGAILVAKTTMTEFAWGIWDTVGSAFEGPTRNPYDPRHASGGSSGGSAVAVSANLAVAGLGSDTGCSVRAPASINNIVGLRPTHGLISCAGLMPMNADWDTVGPMARTVADVRVLLDVLAGVELASNEPRRRVGVPRQLVPDDDMHPEVAALLGGALEACRRVGVSVVDPVPMPTLPEFDAGAWYRRFRHDLDGYLRAHGDCSPHPDLASIIASGRVHQRYLSRLEEHDGITQAPDEAPEREAMLELKARIRAMFSRAMDEHDLDALVFPTFLHPPKLNGNCDGPLGSTNAWASECSFPAVSVPMGFTGAGLPVGLQLMARPWDERRLLAIAAQFERASGHRRPPP